MYLNSLYNQVNTFSGVMGQAYAYPQTAMGNVDYITTTRMRNVIAKGFEVIYKFKMFEKTSSQLVLANTEKEAKEVFLRKFDGEEKQPRIVKVEETLLTL